MKVEGKTIDFTFILGGDLHLQKVLISFRQT